MALIWHHFGSPRRGGGLPSTLPHEQGIHSTTLQHLVLFVASHLTTFAVRLPITPDASWTFFAAAFPDAIPNPEVAVGEANVLDYLLGTIIEMVPTLDTVRLSGLLTDVYRYPRISFIQQLCRANQAQLQRVAFCGFDIPLGVWKAFLSLPALQSLSVDSKHGVVDDDGTTSIDFGLPRGLRYLRIGINRHDLFSAARLPHLEHLSISMAELSLRKPVPSDFRGVFPVLRRLDIHDCWGDGRDRGFLKCASDMADPHLFHLSLPEFAGVHDEVMECVEANGLPSLKRLILFTRRIPSSATTRPNYLADMLSKRSRLATFLQSRDITFYCGVREVGTFCS